MRTSGGTSLKSRRFLSSILGLALIYGANAAHAQAHASEILIGASTLVYEQRPAFNVNLNNNVVISLKSDSFGAYYEVYDPRSTGIVFPPQCLPLDEAQEDIRCPASGINALYVRVGTGTTTSSTTDNITINASTPAIVSGGSVTNAGGPRRSNITIGPVGGNVIYGNPGAGTLNALNGFADTIHSCFGNVVEVDLTDTVIGDCAPPPEPPVAPAPEPAPRPTPKPAPKPTPASTTPASPSTLPPKQPGAPSAAFTQSGAIALKYKQPQAVLRQRLVKFGVSVAMPLVVRAQGTITLPGRGGTANLTTARARIAQIGVAVAVQIHVPSRTLSKLRDAFRHRRRLYARVQVDGTDPVSGIEYSVSRLIALVR
jgi:hypothetical protein